jgi:hypothetical protein
MRYRIRKALISDANHHKSLKYMAERSVVLLGVHLLWWPVINGHWWSHREMAKKDITSDNWLRKELRKCR